MHCVSSVLLAHVQLSLILLSQKLSCHVPASLQTDIANYLLALCQTWIGLTTFSYVHQTFQKCKGETFQSSVHCCHVKVTIPLTHALFKNMQVCSTWPNKLHSLAETHELERFLCISLNSIHIYMFQNAAFYKKSAKKQE